MLSQRQKKMEIMKNLAISKVEYLMNKTRIKHVAKLIQVAMILFLVCIPSITVAVDVLIQNVKTALPIPVVDAKAWALLEFNSGMLVVGNNSELPHPPASITKLMTNYVVFEALRDGGITLNDDVSISEKAWRTEGSRMFAKVDSKVKLKHLLKSTVIQSGNDAAVALAEHVAGSELGFAALMNQASDKIGLNQSRFINATGLPAKEHRMSAQDIAILAAAIIRDYPEYYPWYSEQVYTHNNISQYNRNKLLWKDSSVDGLKTGHTEAAGYCLVGSAKRNGQRWIAVVLGSSDERSREEAVLSLLDFAFNAYKPVRLLDQQGGLASVAVYHGEVDEVLLQANGGIDLVVPAGRQNDVSTEFQLSPYYLAPIEIGQSMGVAVLSLDNKTLANVPLIAMSNIKSGGIWKNLIDSVKLQIRELTD